MGSRALGFVAVVSLSVMTACGSGQQAQLVSPAPASSAPASASATVGTTSLADVCPEVEAAAPQNYLPSADRYRQFAMDLKGIYDSADLEARNALTLLVPGLRKAIATADKQGQPLVQGNQAYLASVTSFARRCKAAGSSAFQ